MTDTLTTPEAGQPAKRGWLQGLYTGTGAFEIVGRRKFYYLLSAGIIAICLLSIALRGFTLGIDFEGGSKISFPATDAISTQQVEDAYDSALGKPPVAVQKVGSGASATFQIRSETLTPEDTSKIQNELFNRFQPKGSDGNPTPNAISTSDVSETWGGQVTRKALIALAVFVVLAMLYIGIRFERDMAIAAIASLFFNMIATAGVYSLVGFEVTPAAIIGLLTILGFVLYDNVVVFDKVEENTRGILHLNKRTYAEQTNLAINQTFMRSINTTIIGVLPVLALIVIAVWYLGVGTLKDLELVQLVGMVVGAYSSIFFATPLLVSIKERWGPVAAHTRKVLARRQGGTPAAAGTGTVSAATLIKEASATPAPGAKPAGKRSKRRR